MKIRVGGQNQREINTNFGSSRSRFVPRISHVPGGGHPRSLYSEIGLLVGLDLAGLGFNERKDSWKYNPNLAASASKGYFKSLQAIYIDLLMLPQLCPYPRRQYNISFSSLIHHRIHYDLPMSTFVLIALHSWSLSHSARLILVRLLTFCHWLPAPRRLLNFISSDSVQSSFLFSVIVKCCQGFLRGSGGGGDGKVARRIERGKSAIDVTYW